MRFLQVIDISIVHQHFIYMKQKMYLSSKKEQQVIKVFDLSCCERFALALSSAESYWPHSKQQKEVVCAQNNGDLTG